MELGILNSQPTSERLRQVLKTVDALYEAACDPAKWSAFLQSAAGLFEAQGAQIGHHDLGNHRLSFSRLYGYEWSDSHYRRYDELMPTDPRLPYFAQNPFEPVHCRMHLSDEELHGTQVYQEILEPGGVEYSLGVNLIEDTRSLSYFLALRNKSQSRFERSDCGLLSELIPHLNRAIILQRDIGSIDFEKNVAANTLDNMAIGVIVVGSSSRIMFSNATAQDILRDLDGLFVVDGVLLSSKANERHLSAAIDFVISQARNRNAVSGQAVSIVRNKSMVPLQLYVSPLLGELTHGGWAGKSEPLAILTIRDSERPMETRQEVLCKAFGLTASQARLVTMISGGLSLQDAAKNAGITEASARQYLKIAFDKMDVSRQGEMVAKVLNLPLPVASSQYAL
ncbi:helix-turn-helix transcriptional regulator [Shimia sp. MMG029]|uniref:helix-turn-helix transcriptional regulator n=1 Tax=Shimia sp. MMG029 TaxID=3021978 RepID=UPI0022FE7950|nr:helix-turn-helix transcriptional regulator [Shimia sp. MMG029]MDA5557169.1 helix-turn-helix transcriptional regulator [Shimia sp. MMG029]